ncbi:MAG: sacsin N-terminal ATP-binding-like domain-containing protein, partial [Sciscionella sp.]
MGAAAGTADPFDTTSIRRTVLDAWRASPTRFREDANAEEDLRLGGYADRLMVELAANAADAALAAGGPGTLRLSLVDLGGSADSADSVDPQGHRELRAANTGAALDAAGVSALASLRASAKVAADTVGRFGVGFAAVLAVSDEPAVLSASGGVRFSLAGTLAEVGEIPELGVVLADRAGTAPVLRLPWPAQPGQDTVPPGFTTEVRLPLRSDVDAEALLADARAKAPDLLLALRGLRRLEIGTESWSRETDGSGAVTLHGPSGDTRWLLHRGHGEFSGAALRGLGVEARGRSGFWTCWAVPVDTAGAPVLVGNDVLHAPTPTDERLSLPARLLATLPVEPTRRRILRGPAVDAVLAAAAADYPGLLFSIDPAQRLRLVPLPGFPLSEVDAVLRDGVLAALTRAAWLPSAAGGDTAPRDAVVLEGASAELVALLADVLPGLLAAELAGPSSDRALAALGVRRIPLAELVDVLAGVARPPEWWRELYAALVPLADTDRGATEELGGLPVPLADGRTVTGPRTVLLPSAELSDVLSTLDTIDIVGLRIAHPAAAHPLLRRLGATEGGAVDLLDVPALRDAVEHSVA